MVFNRAVWENYGAVFALADDFKPTVANLDLPGEGVGSPKANLVLMIDRDSRQFEEEIDRQKPARSVFIALSSGCGCLPAFTGGVISFKFGNLCRDELGEELESQLAFILVN